MVEHGVNAVRGYSSAWGQLVVGFGRERCLGPCFTPTPLISLYGSYGEHRFFDRGGRLIVVPRPRCTDVAHSPEDFYN